MANTEFTVKIPNIEKLTQAFRDSPKIAEPILQKAIVATQFIFAKHTDDSTVPHRSYNLIHSFKFSEEKLKAIWSPTASYAKYVEFGTKPHLIEVVNKRVLATPAKNAPGWPIVSKSGYAIFGTKVHHPGTKANPFMERIMKASQPDINELFKSALQSITKQIAEQSK